MFPLDPQKDKWGPLEQEGALEIISNLSVSQVEKLRFQKGK